MFTVHGEKDPPFFPEPFVYKLTAADKRFLVRKGERDPPLHGGKGGEQTDAAHRGVEQQIAGKLADHVADSFHPGKHLHAGVPDPRAQLSRGGEIPHGAEGGTEGANLLLHALKIRACGKGGNADAEMPRHFDRLRSDGTCRAEKSDTVNHEKRPFFYYMEGRIFLFRARAFNAGRRPTPRRGAAPLPAKGGTLWNPGPIRVFGKVFLYQ